MEFGEIALSAIEFLGDTRKGIRLPHGRNRNTRHPVLIRKPKVHAWIREFLRAKLGLPRQVLS